MQINHWELNVIKFEKKVNPWNFRLYLFYNNL